MPTKHSASVAALSAGRDACRMLHREIAVRGPQTREETLALARYMADLAHAAVGPQDLIDEAVRAGRLRQLESGEYDVAAPCPDVCPVCAADLRREGYPQAHQHADTGGQCAFTWDTDLVAD